jgi:hypothetical protein
MKTIFLILSAGILLFTSCDTPRYAYSQTAHNVPILKKQGDSKIAAYYSNNGSSTQNSTTGTGSSSNQYSKNTAQGADLQAAVAVTKSLAIQGSYFYRAEKTNFTSDYDNNFNSSTIKYKRNLVELGAGFFTPLDSRKYVYFQAFAGGGLGKTTINDKGLDINNSPYDRHYNADITKFYLEPSITFHAKEIFAATVATRVSVIKFRNINSNYSLSEKQDFQLDSLDRFSVAFFEPAFVGSFGFNKLPGFRIEFQAGLSVLWEHDFIDYRPLNLSLGLVLDIRKLMKGVDR